MGQKESKNYIMEDDEETSNRRYPKNIEYYSGQRYFKISRKLYTNDYTRGYIYGYYDNLIDDTMMDENNERSF